MRIIIDENIPTGVREEVQDFHDVDVVNIDQEYKGILDFELVDKMDHDDILLTRDRELHRNMLKTDRKSVYYDIEKDNIVEVQVKISYYLKGYDPGQIEVETEENEEISSGPNALLRKRFEELKEENARLKSRVNVLEGKLKSIKNTVDSTLDNEDDDED